jgi:hypothetical protein
MYTEFSLCFVVFLFNFSVDIKVNYNYFWLLTFAFPNFSIPVEALLR